MSGAQVVQNKASQAPANAATNAPAVAENLGSFKSTSGARSDLLLERPETAGGLEKVNAAVAADLNENNRFASMITESAKELMTGVKHPELNGTQDAMYRAMQQDYIKAAERFKAALGLPAGQEVSLKIDDRYPYAQDVLKDMHTFALVDDNTGKTLIEATWSGRRVCAVTGPQEMKAKEELSAQVIAALRNESSILIARQELNMWKVSDKEMATINEKMCRVLGVNPKDYSVTVVPGQNNDFRATLTDKAGSQIGELQMSDTFKSFDEELSKTWTPPKLHT